MCLFHKDRILEIWISKVAASKRDKIDFFIFNEKSTARMALTPFFSIVLFTDIDNCIGNPCGANECIDKIGGYDCVCRNGYSGSKCQTLPDFCLQNSCQNGATCVTGQTNYTCSCPYGFHGALCESKAGNLIFLSVFMFRLFIFFPASKRDFNRIDAHRSSSRIGLSFNRADVLGTWTRAASSFSDCHLYWYL